jgi:hypothetical protein
LRRVDVRRRMGEPKRWDATGKRQEEMSRKSSVVRLNYMGYHPVFHACQADLARPDAPFTPCAPT